MTRSLDASPTPAISRTGWRAADRSPLMIALCLAAAPFLGCDRDTPAPAEAGAASMLRLSADTVEMGKVLPGDSAPYSFTVHNTSADTPITLNYIWSACGCTTTTPPPVTILPGGDATITGELTVYELTGAGDRAGSAVFLGVDDDHELEVDLDARVPLPFPESVALGADGRIELPLHQRYRGRVLSAVAYPPLSDDPLPGGLTASGETAVFTSHVAADTIDVVLRVRLQDGSSVKVAQTVQFTPVSASAEGVHTHQADPR